MSERSEQKPQVHLNGNTEFHYNRWFAGDRSLEQKMLFDMVTCKDPFTQKLGEAYIVATVTNRGRLMGAFDHFSAFRDAQKEQEATNVVVQGI